MGPVTLIPYAIIHGFPTPPEVSWSITIEVPGLGEQIFQGANNLDFFEASWEAAGADGGALQDGVYTVQVRAEIASEGLVAKKSFPYLIGQTGVLVENLTCDPNPLDFEEQSPGMQGAHFRADLTPVGFEEPVTASWTLELSPVDSDDPVRLMTGEVTLSVGQTEPTRFETFWDGRREPGGTFVSDGDYRVRLVVSVCPNDPDGQNCTSSASVDLTIGDGAALEIMDEETGELLSSTSLPLLQMRKLLARVLLYRPGIKDGLKIRARGLRFESNPAPSTITIILESLTSGKKTTVELHENNGAYEGHFTLTPEFILASFPVGNQTAQTTFATVHGRDVSPVDVADFGAILSSLFYPPPHAQLGRVAYDANPEHDDEVPGSVEAMRSAGFESVKATLVRGTVNPTLLVGAPIVARLKVKHPAQLLLVNAHGVHRHPVSGKLGVLFLNENEELDPSKLEPEDFENVRTLVLASCNALDLHDYNNRITEEHGPSDGLASRPSPGLEWWRATRRGSTVLLGYNNVTYLDQNFFARYLYLLENLRARDPAIRQQHAWLRANLDVEGSVHMTDAGPAACAWDNDYYYYIAVKYADIKDIFPIMSGEIAIAFEPPFRRIPQALWGAELPNWDKIPPPHSIAQPFDIPEVP